MRCEYPKAIAGQVAYIFTIWLWRDNALFEDDNFRGKVFYFGHKRRLQAANQQQMRQKLFNNKEYTLGLDTIDAF